MRLKLFIFGGHPNWSYEDGLFVVLARDFEAATDLCRNYVKRRDTPAGHESPQWDTWERLKFLRPEDVDKETQNGYDTWVLIEAVPVSVLGEPRVLAWAYHSG